MTTLTEVQETRAPAAAPERGLPEPLPSAGAPAVQATRGSAAGTIEPLQLRHELREFDRFPVARLLEAARPDLHAQCVATMARARDYAERHLVGQVERWDEVASQDHDFVPWTAIDAGLPYRFLSMSIPSIFGGGNTGALASALFAEEIATADAGVSVIYGAHGLAIAIAAASLDMAMVSRLGREISEGERQGTAVLLALAHTEPGGGSDVEDVDDFKRAHIGSRFTRVPGGYRLHARKVFISNGSIARYNIVTAASDLTRPLETMRGFVVPSDAPGFVVGRVEHKMGQRLSTAAEIICDDVFVPEKDAILMADAGRVIDTTLSVTRGPVGAISAGIIRGVLERTLRYLGQKRVRGHWLFEEQWVTLALAEMVGALQAARGLYIDASLAGEAWGLASLARPLPPWVPAFLTDNRLVRTVAAHPRVAERARAIYRERVPDALLQRLVGHASIAKFVCSDLAVRMTMKAIEILGEDANDPAWGVEKCMRDAKLTQLFEGTNQINRLHVTRGLVKRA